MNMNPNTNQVFGNGGDDNEALAEQFANEGQGNNHRQAPKRPRIERPEEFDPVAERAFIVAEESRFLQPGEVLSAPHISSILWSRRAASELRFETWRNENEKLRITAEKEEEEVKEKEVAMRALEVEKENAAVAVPISQDLSTPVAKQIANAFIPFIATREGTNESKMALFDSTVTEIVETVCPGMANLYQDRPDPRVTHHSNHFHVLFKLGKYVMRNYLDNMRDRSVRVEADSWYEAFAVLIMAIIKADNALNCQAVYRAYFNVSKQPKYFAGTPLSEYFFQVKDFLGSVFVLALHHHTRDSTVAKAAANSVHAPVQPARKNMSQNLIDAAKAVAAPNPSSKKEGL